MTDAITKHCPGCNRERLIEDFGWSKKRNRPTKRCKECWENPGVMRVTMRGEETDELLLYYSPIRSLMTHINEAQAEAAAGGLPVDRPIQHLGDVWVGEMTEEAYRLIVRALIKKAESGDVNAAKLLLEERHRRLGEPTKEGVEESLAELFNIAPLTPNLDSA